MAKSSMYILHVLFCAIATASSLQFATNTHFPDCIEGNWGYECNKTCNCSVLGTSTCDKVSGTCQCKSGWSGSNCDKDVDECLQNTSICPSHSHCKNTYGGFDCLCDDGFSNSSNKCEATSTYDIQVVFNLTSEDLQFDNKTSTDYKRIAYEVESQMLRALAYANIKVIKVTVTELRKGSLIADIKIFIADNIEREKELTASLKKLENWEVTLNDIQVSIQSIGLKDKAGSDSQQSTLGIYIGVPLGGGTLTISVIIYCCKKVKGSKNKNKSQQRSQNDDHSLSLFSITIIAEPEGKRRPLPPKGHNKSSKKINPKPPDPIVESSDTTNESQPRKKRKRKRARRE